METAESEPLTDYSPTAIHTPLRTDEAGSFKIGSPWPNSSVTNLDPALDRPSDPFEAKTELRYRMSLSHPFQHLNLPLPLWTPSPVEVGAVGYLSKPAGAFRTLFNCCNPSATSGGRLSGIPPLIDATIETKKQNTDLRAKGMKMIKQLASTKSSSTLKRAYAISSFGETAHLIVEKAEHQCFKNIDASKRWFRANVDAIMNVYDRECFKEELFLVFGTVNARDHALFVNHGDSGDELRGTEFNVFSIRRPGEAWGYFSGIPPMDDTEEARKTVFKISDVGLGLNTVLLSRFRFRPDEQEPTPH
ncbi:hypothetical protein DFH09DRAFT_229457 [Mycena vulgaris]|nr:hypothetical protein DFH09DRAFT_229457 [Mycena vulgaris]